MIKKIHEITINDFDLMEKTGKVSHLKLWWNILPSFMFYSRIEKVIIEIQELLQGNSINEDDQIFYKAKSLLKIQILESAYLIIVNQLFGSVSITQLAKDINLKKKLGALKNINMLNALTSIEVLTGLKVENDIIKELQEIQDEIIRLKDKYNENFPVKEEKENTKITLMEFASTYIIYTGGSFIGLAKMTILELVVLKRQAEDKYKKEQEYYNKLKNGGN